MKQLFIFISILLLISNANASTYKVTAYCPCPKCCGKYGWSYTTASGYKIKKGDKLIAAPKDIPFGTSIIIQEYNNNKPVKVLDRGGAIKGNKLDVYFDNHKDALQWGVKYIEIKITNLKKEKHNDIRNSKQNKY